MSMPVSSTCDPQLENCVLDTPVPGPGPSQGIFDARGGVTDYLTLAMTTSVSIVGRAQFMAGIVQLASVNTTGLGKLLGYFNSIFGGGAMIYTFLIDTLNGTLAQKL